jgi:hypothetical protein
MTRPARDVTEEMINRVREKTILAWLKEAGAYANDQMGPSWLTHSSAAERRCTCAASAVR